MTDEKPKLEEIEGSHTLGRSGEVPRGEGSGEGVDATQLSGTLIYNNFCRHDKPGWVAITDAPVCEAGGNFWLVLNPTRGLFNLFFYFQQYKKRAKAKGKKKCHTETMKGRKSRYNLYIREPLMCRLRNPNFFYFFLMFLLFLPCEYDICEAPREAGTGCDSPGSDDIGSRRPRPTGAARFC
jgi:hypothetical protein